MIDDTLVILGQRSIMTALMLALPILGTALAMGIFVSIFQAVTSIQDQTLSFIPKIFAVSLILLFFGPWLSSLMVSFASDLLANINSYIS